MRFFGMLMDPKTKEISSLKRCEECKFIEFISNKDRQIAVFDDKLDDEFQNVLRLERLFKMNEVESYLFPIWFVSEESTIRGGVVVFHVAENFMLLATSNTFGDKLESFIKESKKPFMIDFERS